jgi:hypothetical protein
MCENIARTRAPYLASWTEAGMLFQQGGEPLDEEGCLRSRVDSVQALVVKLIVGIQEGF